MKTIIYIILIAILAGASFFFLRTESGHASKKAGCEAYLYVANNSTFECRLLIDGIPQVGSLLQSKVKTYSVELLNDTPKRVKVKIIYDDPDYLESKSYLMFTHKLECGLTDTMYIAH